MNHIHQRLKTFKRHYPGFIYTKYENLDGEGFTYQFLRSYRRNDKQRIMSMIAKTFEADSRLRCTTSSFWHRHVEYKQRTPTPYADSLLEE